MSFKLAGMIATAAFVLALAGCGGGQTAEPTETAGASQAESAQPATPTERERALPAGEGRDAQKAGDAPATEEATRSLTPEQQVATCEQRSDDEVIDCPTVAEAEADLIAAAEQQAEQRSIERCLKRAEGDRAHLACLPAEQGGPGSSGPHLTTDQQRCQDKAKSAKQSHACLE